MSLLAPLYLAGLAVLSLPIILHLIRRVPRGQMPFSSLMFLRESPPRITRRSRLDHWWLLLLRALIAALLVMAFARPFLRAVAERAAPRNYARRVAVLLDTSASMRRGNLWRDAVARVQQIVREAGPRDEVAVFAFDEQLRPIVDFPRDQSTATGARTLVQQLATWRPSWRGTNLGHALAATADRLGERNDQQQSDAALQIIVVSDMQQGSDVTSLQSYSWPPEVTVELVALEPRKPGNAGLQAIMERTQNDAPEEVRVLLSNDAGSQHEEFTLAWKTAEGKSVGVPAKGYVPPGQARVVRIQRPLDPPTSALHLSGDAYDFDNVVYVAPRARPTARVVYVGSDTVDDPQGMAYFLQHALGDSPHWRTQLEVVSDSQQISALLTEAALAVVAHLEAPATAQALRAYAQQGGTVFAAVPTAASLEALRTLLGETELEIQEAAVDDYAMFAGIDFAHPLFAPLADPQYSDFTKIRFWKTRNVSWSADSTLRTIARFDDQQPALVEQRVGAGIIYVLASTWNPADSQLALSSKFVPLLGGMLRAAGVGAANEVRLQVGQPFLLPPGTGDRMTSVILAPDGTRHELDAEARQFDGLDSPGIYRWQSEDREQLIAVNIAASESRTMPLDASVLEQYAVRIGHQPDAEQQREQQRQLQDQELESRQQIWRWMIAAALVLMVVETGLAGRAARTGATTAQAPR